MDASLPTGKETMLLNAKGINSRLSGRETLSDHGGSSDATGCGFCLAGRCRIGTWNETDLFGAEKCV